MISGYERFLLYNKHGLCNGHYVPIRVVLLPRKSIYHCMLSATVCYSYNIGCPPVRGDNPLAKSRALIHEL